MFLFSPAPFVALAVASLSLSHTSDFFFFSAEKICRNVFIYSSEQKIYTVVLFLLLPLPSRVLRFLPFLVTF